MFGLRDGKRRASCKIYMLHNFLFQCKYTSIQTRYCILPNHKCIVFSQLILHSASYAIIVADACKCDSVALTYNIVLYLITLRTCNFHINVDHWIYTGLTSCLNILWGSPVTP